MATRARKKVSAENGSTGTDIKEQEVMNGAHSPGLSKASSSTRWEVVHRMHLPHFLSDNEFLLNGHRPQLNSFLECAKSIFRMHTETWNIWTHLVGCLWTLVVAVCFWLESLEWPHMLTFSGFFAGAITCLAGSTIFHTLTCHSEPVSKFWSKVDYCGIVFLQVSSFPPWLHYGFYCHRVLETVYLVIILLLGLVCMVAVMSDKFGQTGYYKLRAGLFMALGLSGVVPGIHYMYINGLWESWEYTQWLLLMAGSYLVGGAIYAIRVPERLSPGTFDIHMQSHQILHICVLGGVLSCYIGITRLAADRISAQDFCALN